jgi:hypothetical protein
MQDTPSEAYARLMRTVDPLDGSKLHPHESALLRDAADARLFGDPDADERVEQAGNLIERLIEVDRVQPELGELLYDQLVRIGCHRAVALAA